MLITCFNPAHCIKDKWLGIRIVTRIVSSVTIEQKTSIISTMMSRSKELRARTIFRSADAVCFDVDSTVCQDEAIDELARFAGKENEVSEL